MIATRLRKMSSILTHARSATPTKIDVIIQERGPHSPEPKDLAQRIVTTLAQRFPIYKEGDTNANPTGGIRQIEYQLVDGEASRKFVIKNSTDFPE